MLLSHRGKREWSDDDKGEVTGSHRRILETGRSTHSSSRAPIESVVHAQVGAGRKPKDSRRVFEAFVYVLRTGCQWRALPAERYASASAIHARFLQWEKKGFFEALWKAGLA